MTIILEIPHFKIRFLKIQRAFKTKNFVTNIWAVPCHFVSLKDVNGDNFETAYERFTSTICKLAINYLLNSNKLDEYDKEELSKVLNKSYLDQLKNQNCLKDSLSTLPQYFIKSTKSIQFLLLMSMMFLYREFLTMIL